MYRSPNIVRVFKSRRLRWAGCVARMEEGRSAFKILTDKPTGKRPLGRGETNMFKVLTYFILLISYSPLPYSHFFSPLFNLFFLFITVIRLECSRSVCLIAGEPCTQHRLHPVSRNRWARRAEKPSHNASNGSMWFPCLSCTSWEFMAPT